LTKFGPRTIRARLILITMLVMGGLLAVLGLSVDFAAHKAVLYSIDDDLLHRAHMFAQGPPHGPGPGGWMGLPDFGRGPGDRDGPHGPDGGPGPGPGPDRGGPDWDRDPGHRPGSWQDGPPFPFGASSNPGKGRDSAPPFGPDISADGTISTPAPPPQHFEIGQSNRGHVSYDIEAFELARKTGHSVWTTKLMDGLPFRLLTLPVSKGGKVVRIEEVVSPLEDTLKALADLRHVLISLIIPVGTVLSGLASFYLVSRLTRPLREITRTADAIGAHNAAERLPVVGRDEFASVASTLNRMLDRLEAGLRFEQTTNRQLEQTVIQQRRFTADASHELKTPLAVIKANTGLMLHFGGDAEDMKDSVLSIDSAADRMNRLVQDLLVLARAEAGQLAPRFERSDLRSVVEESIRQLGSAEQRVGYASPTDGVWVNASTNDLSSVFVNLIDNAIRHSGSNCPVDVSISRTETDAVAIIRDHGDGIASEHLPRLFDRFYRTDRSRSSDTGGTGLGLAICKGIVEAHRGAISVASVVGTGTCFTVTLPLMS
jgi:signal transduction histidine kinase